MDLTLEGKTAAVTGAAGGIGRATAFALGAAGARVVVCDVKAKDLDETAAMLRDLQVICRAEVVDVSRRDQVERLIQSCLKLGGLDVLVANAGVSPDKPFLETTEDDLDRTLAVNLKGVFFCGQLAAKAMIAGGSGGCIVNVASTYGQVAAPDCSAYCASKGGVRMLTKAMALELGRHGIRVNAVAPGFIRTAMNPLDDPDEIRRLESVIPAGRTGVPADIADVICWLASDGARYVNGETLFVDGGWLVH
jgi:NAD(P)-dependent dehydrogenase (short-subunit alcohol dehydrogenase family)